MSHIWDIFKAVLQGIVQGITEWLPISSTGHLILVNEFLPFEQSQDWFDVFKVLIQLGSILAVVVLYSACLYVAGVTSVLGFEVSSVLSLQATSEADTSSKHKTIDRTDLSFLFIIFPPFMKFQYLISIPSVFLPRIDCNRTISKRIKTEKVKKTVEKIDSSVKIDSADVSVIKRK